MPTDSSAGAAAGSRRAKPAAVSGPMLPKTKPQPKAKPPSRRKPAAKKRGSGNSDKVFAALLADFKANGSATIERVREKSPERYLALVSSMLSKVPHDHEAAAAISATPAFGPVSETARWIRDQLGPGAVDASA